MAHYNRDNACKRHQVNVDSSCESGSDTSEDEIDPLEPTTDRKARQIHTVCYAL